MPLRTPRELGAVVRRARRQRELTQAGLAEQVGVTRQWVASVEAGKANPSFTTLLRLSEVLGLDLDLAQTAAAVPVQPTRRSRTPLLKAPRGRASAAPLPSPAPPTGVDDLLAEMSADSEVSRGTSLDEQP